MAKLVFLTLFFVASLVQAKTLELELYAQSSLAPKTELAGEVVGGLSGMFWQDRKLTAVSDDRGKLGKPRFYQFDIKLTPEKVDFTIVKAQHFQGVPKDWIQDNEGIALLSGGDMVVSTEGDNNRKPRVNPRLFVTSSLGKYKYEIAVPEKFLPETTGLQKKGVENNRAFEGLTASPQGQSLYILNEYPIIADQSDDDQNFWLRLVEFKKGKSGFKASAEYPYMLTRSPSSSVGVEVFRGISEILFVGDGRFVTLERGVRLTKTGIAYTGGLYFVETDGVKDVSNVQSLADGKNPAVKKTKLVDFEELLKNQKTENYEALAWGPSLPDGRKSLLVLSDNNFSSKEKTTLLVFSVKEVE